MPILFCSTPLLMKAIENPIYFNQLNAINFRPKDVIGVAGKRGDGVDTVAAGPADNTLLYLIFLRPSNRVHSTSALGHYLQNRAGNHSRWRKDAPCRPSTCHQSARGAAVPYSFFSLSTWRENHYHHPVRLHYVHPFQCFISLLLGLDV